MGLGDVFGLGANLDDAELLEGIARAQGYYTTQSFDPHELVLEYESFVTGARNYLSGEYGESDQFGSRIVDGLAIAETQTMLLVLGIKGPIDGFSVAQRREFLNSVSNHSELAYSREQAVTALSGAGLIEAAHYLHR